MRVKENKWQVKCKDSPATAVSKREEVEVTALIEGGRLSTEVWSESPKPAKKGQLNSKAIKITITIIIIANTPMHNVYVYSSFLICHFKYSSTLQWDGF